MNGIGLSGTVSYGKHRMVFPIPVVKYNYNVKTAIRL
jgi:hypothetical protein